ncbi:MAG: peptidylprolyl isomerase, partial [Cyclobacteriaceae bacterium]|nr:peptidylprolyl isomerase [Cyclobacteriaceae bacterium]
MKLLERVVSNVIFFMLCLLTILLIGEHYVIIPVWLWPFGRMHPLLLHFPIALIVLLAILRIFQNQLDPVSFDKVQKFLLYITAFTTTLTALMGFFLSKEPGYVSELMALHKWIGVGVGFLVYGLVLMYNKKRAYNSLLSVCFIAIVFAGHLGAGLTHGMNFLIEPIMTTRANQLTQHTPIYSGFVAPILVQKCQGCHNPQKQKGGLDMSSLYKMYAGGENGPVWQDGNAKESEIVKRAYLPTDHEHHMPPKGKAQLSQAEFGLIYQWIASGADTAVAIADLQESDTLFALASTMLNKRKGSSLSSGYDFDFASKKVIESLNNPYRSVAQITPSSPAISVNIYVRQAYKKEFLSELN